MARSLAEMAQVLASWRRDARRRRNLRAGHRRPRPDVRAASAGVRADVGANARSDTSPGADTSVAARTRAGVQHSGMPHWLPEPSIRGWMLPIACAALMLGGAVLIAVHARNLTAAAAATPVSQAERQATDALQSVLPGAIFDVPSAPGVTLDAHANSAVLIASGMQAAPAVRVDLCTQLRSDGRLMPLHLGQHFSDVERWMESRNESAAPRNVMLVRDDRRMPAIQLSGSASPDVPLHVSWKNEDIPARWVSDATAGKVEQGASADSTLQRQGWLAWADGAIRIERRAAAGCPQAGELLVQLYEGGQDDGRALVVAFAAQSASSVRLPPGRYVIPSAAPTALEDETLFKSLQEHGLVRLSSDGTAEAAPRDLLQWLAAPPDARAASLSGWESVRDDPSTRALMKRLYQQADGAYVRQQIDIFNSERRLLAWRLHAAPHAASAPRAAASDVAATASAARATSARRGSVIALDSATSTGLIGGGPIGVGATGGGARGIGVGVDGGAAGTSAAMPASAARLFADMPVGWAPWTRAAGLGAGVSTLTITLPQPASGSETIDLLLAGHMQGGVAGARVTSVDACTGRACRASTDVQHLTLRPNPGAAQIALRAAPLDISSAAQPGDQQYRHLRVTNGKLQWHALSRSPSALAARGVSAAAVRIEDRNGAPLWGDSAPLPAAREAGLATMLGISPDHASSVAGVLARAAAGASSSGRLTVDLNLQATAQAILECQGQRQGRWDGKQCHNSTIPPVGRHAGFVLLDAENGDILAAAGSGEPQLGPENWQEAHDFDRSNPARSPLRLPALQHDGGANNSPGSTFKIISALGLERAAQNDPQLNALLGGLPLNAINAMADARGFAFRTGAAIYPMTPHQAHITNYHEQNVDRRAQEGRLGVQQALTYSINTWFAWSGELSDRSLLGRADGGIPDMQPLEAGALDAARPILAAARQLGFEQPMHLDGGLLPKDFAWTAYDALQATPARIDPIHSRHELRQMSIGLRMQATPLQMALASAAIGSGRTVTPRLLLALDGKQAADVDGLPLGVRLDRIRAGMKGVVDIGTGAGAFGGPAMAPIRRGLYGKTGTAPVSDKEATVWFTGWLEPNTLPNQPHRLAFAAFISHSQASGGEHAAPIIAAMLSAMAGQNDEKKGK